MSGATTWVAIQVSVIMARQTISPESARAATTCCREVEPTILNFAGPLGLLNERLYELAKSDHQIVSVVNVGPPGASTQTTDQSYQPEIEQVVPVKNIGFDIKK